VSRLIEVPIDELNRRFKIARKPYNAQPAANDPQPPNINQTNIKPARRLAERRILGILLSEPDRWHDVQVGVGIDDFLDEKHRQIAEVYWTYQRDEGGLVFSTFLSLIDADLRELAIELVEEVEGLRDSDSRPAAGAKGGTTGGNDPKAFLDQTLQQAVDYLADAKRLREQQKLLAAIGRSSENSGDEQIDQVKLFETLVKNKPSTNVNWIGPVKRSR
jgi:hypothetical protein